MNLKMVSLCLLLTLSLLAFPVAAQSIPLPTAPWYAVMWARGGDQLHWINPDGVIASVQRPQLNQEAEDADIRLNFSRDGRFLLQAGQTQAGNEVLGIYDLFSGDFTATVAAQDGVEIDLGAGLSSNAAGSRAAVAFLPSDANDGGWQIIAFDLESGSPLATLEDSQMTGDAATPLYPRIRLYQTRAQSEQDIIHFQLLPKSGALPDRASAYAWLPGATAATFLQSSPFERTAADLDVTTGDEVFTFEDEALQLTAFAASDRTHNAIARYAPVSPGALPETLYLDGQRYLSQPRWSKGGEWVALYTESGEQGVTVGWQVLSLAASPSERRLVPLPVDLRTVVATPDGLLTAAADGRLRHVTSLDEVEGRLLYAPEDNALQLIQIVFASATNDSFALSALSAAAAN